MKAKTLIDTRIVYAGNAFAELVLWRLPQPLAGATHRFKYRLAYVVAGKCVIRYDNEAGKGDHRHIRNRESSYAFVDVETLLANFQREIRKAST